MPLKYVCSECGKKYDLQTMVFRCECGGLLDLHKTGFRFSNDDILKDQWNMFRYLKALPFRDDFKAWEHISMGEGLTPIVCLDEDTPNILVKVDYMMPTLSFKDRGAAVLISKAKELGVKKVVEDSSGNAGASIAAYAKRAGIACDIYVPESTSDKKIRQISSYGASIHIVRGSREDTARETLKAAEGEGVFYASHVYNPFFYEGTKTYAYEIYEQLNGDMPDMVVIPVGNGTLVLGAYYGFKELLESKLIEKMPKIIAVQSENCPPIYEAFKEEREYIKKVDTSPTEAEGIAIAEPMRGKQILKAIKDTQGEIITAPEEEILKTKSYLAKKGFYVEPTTAATVAGYLNYYKNNSSKVGAKAIIPLCGAGLKSH